ncbi:LamG-like jellyroll fold domain-containing protein [Paenibacillus sp. S150]|uniref:LamG-like jellyroll fold domain-containing protein n=1 Tax=Paenibacillus sp. S150 TaxID=2749826 RepID=UPI001C598C4E|nr:LamG-like jellyroll fold domain-containing protein [Paenibacillus sp. S150]MBW4080328.1 S-layer homology domain-containing protein [Paenibacillus sp. S150]
MGRKRGKLSAALLALALIVPSPLAAADGAAVKQTSGQTIQKPAPDYTGHWAQTDFQEWVDKGLVSGYGNGSYKPDQAITRAEWVVLINRVFNLQAGNESGFSDVAETSAYYTDISKAAAAGYASGYSDGTFRPDRTLSRQEAAVMLFRLFQLDASAGTAVPRDAADLPAWSREAVLSLLGEGYLGGYEDGSFKGARAVTRAEALRMIGKLAGETLLQAGAYSEITARNMVVGRPGIELKNSSLSGNLYLTEGIDEGNLTLDNVNIAGTIFVSGGGGNSIILNNVTASEIVVNKRNGQLRIVAQGNTAVPSVRVRSGVKLEEDGAGTGIGFSKLIVEHSLPEGTVIELSGDFDSVDMQALGEPVLYLSHGSIGQLTLNQKAGLRVDAGAEIGNLILGVDELITVQGTGKVAFDDKFSTNIRFETEAATATASAASGGSGGGSATSVPSATPTAAPTATPTAAPSATAPAAPGIPPEAAAPVFSNVSVHDPSVVKTGGTYYVFGSHIEAAQSDDLMNWSTFTNGYTTPGNALYGDLSANLAGSFAWAGENDSDSQGGFSVWAPFVFWNEDYVNKDGSKGAYMIYYCTSSTYIRSAIGFAVSQNIEGPYIYGDTILYSGFTLNEQYDANSTINKQWTHTNLQSLIGEGILDGVNPSWFNADGSYMNKVYTNAIDPNLFYDKDGKLWMTYGSWSGGIFMLEIDPVSGEPKFPGKDGTTSDGRLVDRYFGTKISGGNYKSGEGPYVVYDKNTDYYYLYVTYGGLASDGGYNMRLFRSANPDGPYKDAAGQNAVLATDGDHSAIGNKLLGNFLFSNLNGEADFPAYGYVSSGHNSVYYDEQLGKLFNFFHTRFPARGETHELRVHQMFMNEEAWPVVAPHRYSGETLEKVERSEVTGAYQFVNHGKDTSAKIKSTVDVELLEDGTIAGSATGTWELKDDYYVDLLIDETDNGSTVQRQYKGVFVKQWDSTRNAGVMAFTAMSDQGAAVWGSAIERLSDEQLVANAAAGLSLGDTSKVYKDLELPTSGVHSSVIAWSSSNEAVVGADGKVTRPAPGTGNAAAELTATITLGAATAAKTFTVVVVELSGSVLEDGLTAAYDFEGNLAESGERLAAATVTGNFINNTGGAVTYENGEDGLAVKLDGSSGIRLPDGLINGSAYTISIWLNPGQLTAYTPAFFGARTGTNWISLLPYGNAGATTRMWFGSDTWLDADAGLQIPAGQWSHVAFTYDAGTVKLYIDGVLKYTGTGFTDVFAGPDSIFALGVNYWDVPYQGMIDKFRVYEKALAPEVVGWLVNGEPDADVKVGSITFAAAEKSIAAGNTYAPQVTISPANAGNRLLAWTSSGPEVAAVDAASGVVTAKAPGAAVITGTATDGSGVSASYAVTVTDGKVAHYAFEGDLKDSLQLAGEGQATGMLITSPTVGSVTYGEGVSGQAALFDGASGIRLPDGLIDTDTYSVALWLNPEQLTNYTTAFFGAGTNSSWISFVPQSPSDLTMLWANAAYEADAGIKIPVNEWSHIAFTVANGTVKVYINGVEKFSGTGFPSIFSNNTGIFTLGVNYWDAPFKGLIDELKIFSNVLTPEAIAAEFNLGGN